MSDLISRADAIEEISRSSMYAWSLEQDTVAHNWALRIIQSLPSADRPQGDISEDGTLKVNVTDGAKVKRVLVLGGNNFGGLYYPE